MIVILQKDLKIDQLVHVEGWPNGCVFQYKGTVNGEHQLRTPKTKKLYRTRNNLTYTHRNTPA